MSKEVTIFHANGVVWDLDGTLLDGLRLGETVLAEVLLRHGMTVPSHEVFMRNSHGRLKDSIREMCDVEGRLLDKIYDEFIQSEERHYGQPAGLYFDDALDLLRRDHVEGLSQIIISNRPHYSDSRLGSPRNLAKRPPLAGLIQAVVCGDDDDEFHKPDPRVLDKAERALGLSRDELIVVGDQYVDAELAHNLGVPAVLVARDGTTIPHLDRLSDDWEGKVCIVNDLRAVSIVPLV